MRSYPLHRGAPFTEGDPSSIQVLRYRLTANTTSASAVIRPTGEAMDRQFELLDRWGFTLITFDDYRLFREGELHLPRRPIIVTFDGGIQALYRDVLPSLRLNGLRAVAFVPTGASPVRRSPDPGRGTVDPPFDPEHLVALLECGCEIGSLTCSDAPLGAQPVDVIRRELSLSREILEHVTGARVLTLAYPGGYTNDIVKCAAQEAGYMFAVGVQTPHAVFGSDLFEIRRRTVDVATGTLALALSAFAPGTRLGTFSLRSISRIRRPADAPAVRPPL